MARKPIDLLPVSVIEMVFGGVSVSSQIEGFEDFHVFDASLPDDRAHLAGLGVLAASNGPNFIVMRREGSGKANFKFNFQKNSDNNVIFIGNYFDQTIDCSIKGHRNIAIYCDLIKSKTKISLRGNDNFISVGKNTSINQASILAEGSGTSVLIGPDCMLSYGINIRTSDSHAIIDLGSGAHINAPQNVEIGPSVWVAADATIMKGVHIGEGAIIAASSVVTSDVPGTALVAGIPARVLRNNVSWLRTPEPRPEQIAALMGRFTPKVS